MAKWPKKERKFISESTFTTHSSFVGYYSTRTHTTSLKKELKEEDDLEPTFSSSFNFLWSFLHLTETKVERKKEDRSKKKLCCRWQWQAYARTFTEYNLLTTLTHKTVTKQKGILSDDDDGDTQERREKNKCKEKLSRKRAARDQRGEICFLGIFMVSVNGNVTYGLFCCFCCLLQQQKRYVIRRL